jgi:4-hydroxy-tetrahydrodipicolinate reductase
VRRVGVVGAAGAMGALACSAVTAADDLALTALVDPHQGTVADGAVWASSIEALDPGLVDVVVDFTRADVARRTLAWATANKKDAVVGTSGLTEEDLATATAGGLGSRILVVPNFSVGAVLLQRFAVAAAAQFESVEVIELHHDHKRDAPSGTSLATSAAIAASRAAAGRRDVVDPTEQLTLEGARGALGPGGVRVHSVRLPGLVAHQEVLFGSPGEGLTLRHDVYDRASYMAGLLLALRRIDRVEGLRVGLEHVLDS